VGPARSERLISWVQWGQDARRACVLLHGFILQHIAFDRDDCAGSPMTCEAAAWISDWPVNFPLSINCGALSGVSK
jgi:hypothetical protein